VGDHCYQHTIVWPSRRNTENQAWPDLRDHA
jgi:hypothetical protein